MQSEQRLLRLRELRSKIDREIREIETEEAHRAKKAADRANIGLPRTRRRKAEDRVTKHLEILGVTAHDVKEWALDAGLIQVISRGRVKQALVDAYEEAHTPCICGIGGGPSRLHDDLCPNRRAS